MYYTVMCGISLLAQLLIVLIHILLALTYGIVTKYGQTFSSEFV